MEINFFFIEIILYYPVSSFFSSMAYTRVRQMEMKASSGGGGDRMVNKVETSKRQKMSP